MLSDRPHPTHRMVAKELVQNAKIVDASTKIAEGAVVKLVPNAACAA